MSLDDHPVVALLRLGIPLAIVSHVSLTIMNAMGESTTAGETELTSPTGAPFLDAFSEAA